MLKLERVKVCLMEIVSFKLEAKFVSEPKFIAGGIYLIGIDIVQIIFILSLIILALCWHFQGKQFSIQSLRNS